MSQNLTNLISCNPRIWLKLSVICSKIEHFLRTCWVPCSLQLCSFPLSFSFLTIDPRSFSWLPSETNYLLDWLMLFYPGYSNMTVCPQGYYCLAGTGYDPEPCPHGTFKNTTGGENSSICSPCLGGKFIYYFKICYSHVVNHAWHCLS